MIDNFKLIKSLLNFEDEYDFYFVQVLQRKKEHLELGNNSRLIKCYYIFSTEQLDKRKEEMIKLAEVFNARLYIHLNKRNTRRIGFEMMQDLAKRLMDGTIESLHHIYDSTCGKHHQDKNKKWIVDLDGVNIKDPMIDQFVLDLEKIEPFGDKCIEVIPTKNGVHLITKPFNKQVFKNMYSSIEIHCENPTILYIP